jgi:endo-1,4-beta-D-glucanase Y
MEMKRNCLKAFLCIVIPMLSVNAMAVPLTVNVINNSPAVAHVDYTSFITISPALLDGGNMPYLSTTTFSADTTSGQSLQFAQYGAGGILGADIPKCYYSFSLSGSTWSYKASTDTTAKYCSMQQSGNVFTATLAWPPAAAVDYMAVANNANTIVKGFLTKQPNNAHYLVANQVPLSQAQMDKFVDAAATSGWSLQFAYDSIRLPLWAGAYYAQSTNKSTLTPIGSYLSGLNTFIQGNTCQNSDGNTSVNTSGFWAATTSFGEAGTPVEKQACSTTPAFEGPLAMAAKALNNTTLTNSLVKTLNSYAIDKNTFQAFADANGTTLSQSTYTTSSSPYFNASLDLISQALLIGNGSFNISDSNNHGTTSSDYLNNEKFQANYQAWLKSGFVVDFDAPLPGNGTVTETSKRVLFSTYNAMDYKNNDAPNTEGNSPTVSEGMGYGLLIAYAAHDQTTFNQFLKYVLSISYYEGCAGVTEDQSACAIKSQYLMPWMVDERGKAFKYTIGGGYMTNGSATDADMQIILALDLAQKRVDAGEWTATTFNGLNYGQLATAMTNEVNRYEINYGVTYYDAGGTDQMLSGNGVMFSPGSQWGMPSDASSTNLIYPGYITPQAFEVLKQRQSQ